MDHLGTAAEQRELTSDQVNYACKFFRDQVDVIKLLYKLDSKPAYVHLNWTSKIFLAMIRRTEELTGVNTIKFFLTDVLFADVDNLMSGLDIHIQFIIKQMSVQFDGKTNYFPCKIRRTLHIQAARLNISEFIYTYNKFVPQNCYLTSNLSTIYKTRLAVHIETIGNLIVSALKRLDYFYGLHNLYFSRGPCSLIVDFVGGEEWRCSGGCNEVLDCSSDFKIFDCCNHLYCGKCYLELYDKKVHLCPKCSSRVSVMSTLSKLKEECGEGGSRLYSEFCQCAGGRKRAEASGLACSTDVVSAGQSDAGDLVATVTEAHPEPNLNVNCAEQAMYSSEQAMDEAIDSNRVDSIALQPHPDLGEQAVNEQPVDEHVGVEFSIVHDGIKYQIQQDPARDDEIADDKAKIGVLVDMPVAPGNEGEEHANVAVVMMNEDDLPEALEAEDGRLVWELHEGYTDEGKFYYYVLQETNQI